MILVLGQDKKILQDLNSNFNKIAKVNCTWGQLRCYYTDIKSLERYFKSPVQY